MNPIAATARAELLLPADTIYLDHAATAPRFRAAVERMERFYREENASIHRGNYPLSLQATRMYEDARSMVARFVHAADLREIVFTKSATEAANLLAFSLASRLQPGDNLVATALEHHANLLPWQRLCQQRGCELRLLPVRPDGALAMEQAEQTIDGRTRLVCVSAMSNVTGERPDLDLFARLAHGAGALLVVDGAQAAAHQLLDVQALGCDFLFLSAHKLGGPMGVGMLYGRLALLESLPPFLLGGGMVEVVGPGAPRWKQAPWRFEAGTPDVAGALGFAAALARWEALGPAALFQRERALARQLRSDLSAIDGVQLVGGGPDCPTIALRSARYAPYDLGVLLAAAGISVRCGQHCAQPYLAQLGLQGLCRLSLGFYHTEEELAQVSGTLARLHRKAGEAHGIL